MSTPRIFQPVAVIVFVLAPSAGLSLRASDDRTLPPSAAAITDVVHVDDCNDPDSPLPTWICREARPFLPPGYPYYVGHDEPEMEFFSNKPGSGNNVRWKLLLPALDPTPTQNGSRVANRELFPTFWISMALCDPQSTPLGRASRTAIRTRAPRDRRFSNCSSIPLGRVVPAMIPNGAPR